MLRRSTSPGLAGSSAPGAAGPSAPDPAKPDAPEPMRPRRVPVEPLLPARLRRLGSSTFRSLRVRNYRLYFLGQMVSVSGTWMQNVAQGWLVLRLTGSGVALGTVVALQFLPMLMFGPVGGLVADRFDKRRILFATQSSAGLLALALGLLTARHIVSVLDVDVLAALLGVVNLFDNPARQSFVVEMVGPKDLPNAISLNSVVMNTARVIGPALAGVLIATVGIAVCFLANAASYLAVLGGLALMREAELYRAPQAPRRRGQLREGLAYAWREADIRDVLVAVAVVGTLAYNFQVTLALLAKQTFRGGAGTYSLLTSLMGGGAVAGGLLVASRRSPTPGRLAALAFGFGLFVLGVAAAPSLAVAAGLAVPMGAASIAFIATANTSLQLAAAPTMRGRVMALYAIAFLGSTPIGGPLVGFVGEVAGARAALGLGGVATVATGLVLAWRAGLVRHAASRPAWQERPRELALACAEPGEATGELVLPGEESDDRPDARLRGGSAGGRGAMGEAS
jgi:MFS family permease